LEVFILGISGLGLDWDWVGRLTGWIRGAEGVDKYVLKRFDACNWYISFCWMCGRRSCRPVAWSLSIVDDANSRPEVKVVLTRQ
jgi:hypothetical protein